MGLTLVRKTKHKYKTSSQIKDMSKGEGHLLKNVTNEGNLGGWWVPTQQSWDAHGAGVPSSHQMNYNFWVNFSHPLRKRRSILGARQRPNTRPQKFALTKEHIPNSQDNPPKKRDLSQCELDHHSLLNLSIQLLTGPLTVIFISSASGNIHQWHVSKQLCWSRTRSMEQLAMLSIHWMCISTKL